jgi:hypothetical protein
MARNLRLQCLGAIYQVISCGERRERVFLDDADCWLFAFPGGSPGGWQWGSEKRTTGSAMNTGIQNGDMLGSDSFGHLTTPCYLFGFNKGRMFRCDTNGVRPADVRQCKDL